MNEVRLIDANALKEVVHNSNLSGNREWLIMELDKIIDNAPTVERPQGEWNKCFDKKDYFIGWKCSRCEKICKGIYNYCPNCGADMREEKE